MQLTLHIPSPTHTDIHTWNIRPEKCDNVTLAFEKTWVFNCFRLKTRRRKIFGQQFWPRSITTLAMQLSNKQTDPTNAFVQNERQSGEAQWAMSNLFQKNSKITMKTIQNFDENCPTKIGENWHAAQVSGVPSISPKTLAFPSLL